MLRDERREPIERPVPNPPKREPTYELPRRDEFDSPEYDCPDFRYPMMPMYPRNMYPCPPPYPYPERDMYGDQRLDIEEMMRRNPRLKRCVMECIERCGCGCKPYNSRPTPRRCTERTSYDLDENDIYEFSDAELESFVDATEVEINQED